MGDEPISVGEPPSSLSSPRSADDLLKGFRTVLAALMRSDAVERGDVETALAHLTEVSAHVLRVERASVWRFEKDKAELFCVDLYERFTDRHMSGTVLRALETPKYFAAMREERSIAAHDARRDPRTSEFSENYLAPLGIAAMLDAPVLLQGELVGVVCHEHVGQPRAWLPWEELVAGSFADFVAMVLGAAERNAQARELARYRDELEERVEDRTRKLKESEGNLRQLFNASPVALVLVRSEDSTVLTMNSRASGLFGVDAAEAVGRPAQDFWVDPADEQKLLAAVDKTSVEHFETRLKRLEDGSPFWADLAAQAMCFEGVPSLLMGVHDVTAQKTIEDRLRELAAKDSLTGLLNRRRLFEVSEEELVRSTRYGRGVSLAMLDADHFKHINDIYGHSAGDAALASMAKIIVAELRRIDIVGRYGGEEFVVLLPETGIDAATRTMERIRAAIAAKPPTHDGQPLPLTVSIGVVERHPAEPLADLLRRADEAVYAAKAEGRDRVITR